MSIAHTMSQRVFRSINMDIGPNLDRAAKSTLGLRALHLKIGSIIPSGVEVATVLSAPSTVPPIEGIYINRPEAKTAHEPPLPATASDGCPPARAADPL